MHVRHRPHAEQGGADGSSSYGFLADRCVDYAIMAEPVHQPRRHRKRRRTRHRPRCLRHQENVLVTPHLLGYGLSEGLGHGQAAGTVLGSGIDVSRAPRSGRGRGGPGELAGLVELGLDLGLRLGQRGRAQVPRPSQQGVRCRPLRLFFAGPVTASVAAA